MVYVPMGADTIVQKIGLSVKDCEQKLGLDNRIFAMRIRLLTVVLIRVTFPL